jgi:adenylate cyclase
VTTERRLAAVMFTDTVGYTASTQANEGESLDQLRQQGELVRPILALHKGREIKSTGDGLLVEFDSALKAVQCAINVQRRLFERNSEGGFAPIRIRIGVHLGDVVENGTDILGDAVNIAARIEPLAEPGGICVSGAVYEQVHAKIPDKFAKLPTQTLKGMRSPIDVYRVVLSWQDSRHAAEAPPADQNRLAVLPFANISPDPGDEYFADGLTEELIANLSLVPGLKVIARTSVNGYKKTEKSVAVIGRELGVSTIVEGSVRRAERRIRVTVQVIDVATEEHLWTSKYDDNLDDIFAVQSDIASRVATSLPGNLQKARAPVPKLEQPTESQAYLDFLQGQALVWSQDEPSLKKSVEFLEKSIRTDPTYARAHAALARAFIGLGIEGYVPWMDAIKIGRASSERAMAIDPEVAEAHAARAEIAFMADEPADVITREVRRALELNPNLAQGHSTLCALASAFSVVEAYVGQGEEAYHLDPLAPETIRRLGDAYFCCGQIDKALAHWQKNLERAPIYAYRGLTDIAILNGQLDLAETYVKQLERIAPTNDYTLLCRGFLSACKGDREGALSAIAKLNETQHQGNSRQLSSIGFIHFALGDLDRYFEFMNQAAKEHTLQLGRVRLSPLLAAARRDPRFLELISQF